jgi:hypothetical protein
MDLAVDTLTYKCGHSHSKTHFEDFEEYQAALIESAVSFLCPQCCRAQFVLLELNCQAYANLVQMSSEMSAFTIEVSQVIDPLSELLEVNGYQQRAPSVDELTPGGEPFDLPHSVWRKEFWFANSTDPEHVVALMNHLKQEMDWLSTYLPKGKAGVHYGEFM